MKSKKTRPASTATVIDPDTVMKRVLHTGGLEKQPKEKRGRAAAKMPTNGKKVDAKVAPQQKNGRNQTINQARAAQDRRLEARKTTGRPRAPRSHRD